MESANAATTPIGAQLETKLAPTYDLELTSLKLAHRNLTECDNLDSGANVAGQLTYSIPYWNVVSSTISIIMRPCVIAINWYLVYDYYQREAYAYSAWTASSILFPMFVTMLIYYNMLSQDDGVIGCSLKKLDQLVLSYLLRDGRSWLYARKCCRAKELCLREFQIKYFKLYIIEESDVAFLKIFDSFLESASQKILQISIILSSYNKITFLQALSISMYFISIAWCLAAYNRANRLAQIDKHNIGSVGFMFQLAYHLCLTVSRTLCIAFVASLFPLQTFAICSIRVLLSGVLIFGIDRPKFSTSVFNFFLSVVMGVVYLFTLLPITDSPTRSKYVVFHTVCNLENITCVILYMLYANVAFTAYINFIYVLCAIAISFYFIGMLLMIVYYKHYHPQITARSVR